MLDTVDAHHSLGGRSAEDGVEQPEVTAVGEAGRREDLPGADLQVEGPEARAGKAGELKAWRTARANPTIA